MRILRAFARYSSLERRWVMKAWLTLVAVRTLLWVAPYRWMEARFQPPPSPAATAITPAEIALAVTRASKLVPFATCLTQALAGGYLIRRAGNNSTIHFGVAKGDEGFKAHAWLETDGAVVLGGREAAAYLPLTRASGSPR